MIEGLLIIMGYCSLINGECGAVFSQPVEAFKNIEECREAARSVAEDREAQEEAIASDAIAPPPYVTVVRCGTKRQADEIIANVKEASGEEVHGEGLGKDGERSEPNSLPDRGGRGCDRGGQRDRDQGRGA